MVDRCVANMGWDLASRHSSPLGNTPRGVCSTTSISPQCREGSHAGAQPKGRPPLGVSSPGQSWLLRARTTCPASPPAVRLWGTARRDGAATNWTVTTGDLRAPGQILAKISHIQNLSIGYSQGVWYRTDRAPQSGHQDDPSGLSSGTRSARHAISHPYVHNSPGNFSEVAEVLAHAN